MRNLTLTRQIINITVILLFLTALVTALPPLLLLQSELGRQIDLRLDAGEAHTRTIWALTEFQIQQSVRLASQRPTLRQLATTGDQTTLDSYLETFRSSTLLDFLYVRAADDRILGGISPDAPIEAGDLSSENRLAIFAVQSHVTDDIIVVGGIQLDDNFLQRLSEQTHLTYQVGVHPVDGNIYRSRQVNLTDGFTLEMLLNIEEVRFIQISAFIIVLSATLLTATGGSLLGGLYLRHRIRPLWRLRDAAKNLGQGDLTTPIIVETYSPEIHTLAETLEQGRQHISRMMQQLQQERDWSSALMQSIVEGIVTINRQGVIMFHSASTRQMMNWEQDRVGEKVDQVFVTPDAAQSILAQLPPAGGRKSILVQSPRNYPIILSVTRARTLPDGEITLVLRDVTEESRHTHAQAYYLATMSHEFRTPLSGMKASLELLIENERALARSERQLLLNSLLMSVSNLQRLIDNLLESSKLQSQKFSLHSQPVRFEQILVDVLHMMQPLLNRRQQFLTLTLPVGLSKTIQADRTRLVQVLVNLLSNASKYSPEATEIDLTVSYKDSELWVGIADRGQGVPENWREVIFHQFVRLEQGAETDHGTGLGLSVVRGIIEAHGGSVGVTARDGGGSVFWFSIPLIKEQAV